MSDNIHGGELVLGRAALPFSVQICLRFLLPSLGMTLIVWALFVTELGWGCQRNVEVGVVEVLY